jgi:arylsulfatase A-like enzyme
LREGEEEQEQFTVDFSGPITRGVNEIGFDYFFGTAGCTTDDPPFCFIKNHRTVGTPNVLVSVDPADEDRRLLSVEGWRHEDADLRFAEEAVRFIEQQAGRRPFFLYLPTSVPHIPWLPPDNFKGKSRAGPRGDQVVLFDWMVGQVAAALDRCDVTEKTLLIVTSDNGPREGVHGHRSAGPLRGGKGSIWEGGHRVPFIVRWPGRIPAGSRCDETVCLTDLMATFASILESPLPPGAGEDSYDLTPVFSGNSLQDPIREATVHHSGGGVFAIRQGKWKMIEGSREGGYHDGPDPNSPGQLYDLSVDLQEQQNLWNQRPDIVARLSRLLDRYRDQGHSRGPHITRPPSSKAQP